MTNKDSNSHSMLEFRQLQPDPSGFHKSVRQLAIPKKVNKYLMNQIKHRNLSQNVDIKLAEEQFAANICS